MTDDNAKLLVVAMELLRAQLVDDATHRLRNQARTADDEPPAWTKGFSTLFSDRDNVKDAGPVDPEGKGEVRLDNSQAVRVTIVGHQGQPVPVFLVGGRAEYEHDQEQRTRELAEAGPSGRQAGQPGDKRRPAPEKERDNPIAKALFSRFALILGPLTALSTVLNSTNSGFGVFQKSVQLFGAVLAPVVLPAFVLLATWVLQVSTVISSRLLPAMKDWYTWFLKNGIPEVEKAAGRAGDAVDTVTDLKNLVTKGELPAAEKLPRLVETIGRNMDPSGVTGFLMDKFKPEGFDERRRQFERDGAAARAAAEHGPRAADLVGANQPGVSMPAAPGQQPGRPGIDRPLTTKESLELVVRSLEASLGPKASYGSIGGAREAATLAGLNQDPIEKLTLDIQRQSLIELRKAVAELEKQNQGTDPPAQTNRQR